jgi:hypothetical protein
MAKIKVRVKLGSKGRPLGEYIAQGRVEQGREQKGQKEIYKPKARMNIHIHDGRR